MPTRDVVKNTPETLCSLIDPGSNDRNNAPQECPTSTPNEILVKAEVMKNEPVSLCEKMEIEECPIDLLCDETVSDDFEFLYDDNDYEMSEGEFCDYDKTDILSYTPSSIDVQPNCVQSTLVNHPVFNLISDEVVLHIFKYLPRWALLTCTLVCKRWRDICHDESLWRKLDMGQRIIKPGLLETVFTSGVVALRLAKSQFKYPIFSPSFLNKPRLAAVQYLDLSLATVSAEGLADILYVCVNLKKLSIENCAVNDYCLKNISKNKKLFVLNMAMCSGVTVSGLRAICIKCEKLTDLSLAWVQLPLKDWLSILPFIPKSIERLNVSGQKENFNDECLLNVVNRCLNIIELDISDCRQVTSESFEVMVKNCAKLEHLHTSRAYRIPTESNRLLRALPKFKNLEVFKTLNDDALDSLRKYLSPVEINKNIFSTIARPTTGGFQTSIWGIRTNDDILYNYRFKLKIRKNSQDY